MLLFAFEIIPDESDRDFMYRIASKFQRHMLKTAIDILKDNNIAEDIVQDAFVKLYSKCSKLRKLNENKLAFYITKSVRNLCIDSKRAMRRKTVPLDSVSEDDIGGEPLTPEELFLLNERDGELHALMAMLSEKDRYLLYAHYFENVDELTVCKHLNISPGYYRMYLSRVRRKLSELAKKEGDLFDRQV